MNIIVKLLLYTLSFFLLLTFLPGIPPYIDFFYFDPNPVIPLEGPLSPNTLLENSEKLMEGQVQVPESIAIWQDTIYSGTLGGDIVTIPDGKVVAHLGPHCPSYQRQKRACSFPLGMRFNDEGTLYVTDGNLGLFSVNVENGKTKHLLTSDHVADGEALRFFDDIDVGSDGILYAAITSTVATVSQTVIGVLGGFNGIVIKYDPFHNETTVLMRKLNGPVGIQLSSNNKYLLVSEFLSYRVLKYHLSGTEKGKTEVFLETPGGCDNIRLANNGNYLIGIANPVTSDKNDFAGVLGRHPYIRLLLVRILYNIYKLADFIDRLIPNSFFYDVADNILDVSIEIFKYGLVIEVNSKGKIVKSWHSPSGNISHISQATQYKKYLYLSSTKSNYIGRIPYE